MKTRRIVMASMLAALCCVATMIIKIPSPLNGYLNLGDCVVLLSGFMLSPTYGFAAAAIGSGLADIFSGYAFYAPVTFIIKGIMALIAHYGGKKGSTTARLIGGGAAEFFMVLGYFIFEGCIYGFTPSAANIPANMIQGVAGLIIGVLLARIFEKEKIF